MKEISFSRNSLAFRLLCWYDSIYAHRPPEDICSFGRAFFWQTLKHLFFLAVGLLVMGVFGGILLKSPIGQWFMGEVNFSTWYTIFQIIVVELFGIVLAALVFGLLLSVAGVVWVLGYLKDQLVYWFDQAQPLDKKPNPVVSAYRAFKEKTCYKIKFD